MTRLFRCTPPAAAAAPALSPAAGEGDAATIRSSLGGPCRIRAEARMSVTGQEGAVPIQRPAVSRILFETRPGGVYVLTVEPGKMVPQRAPRALQSGAATPPTSPGSRPLQILLAEDNPVNQKVAVCLLEKRGHRVTVAQDGQAAVTALAAGAYDLVLMDVEMPAMNGIEATKAIRGREGREGGHIPIIALTAQGPGKVALTL